MLTSLRKLLVLDGLMFYFTLSLLSSLKWLAVPYCQEIPCKNSSPHWPSLENSVPVKQRKPKLFSSFVALLFFIFLKIFPLSCLVIYSRVPFSNISCIECGVYIHPQGMKSIIHVLHKQCTICPASFLLLWFWTRSIFLHHCSYPRLYSTSPWFHQHYCKVLIWVYSLQL